ncbi:MAG: hypothetical protein ACKVJK_01890 [Methylophagaceae bacterium]|jgi:hypothetical protein|tara:strand:- start:16 stop:213 length:198 start_codon:yes stop_codon:yes gene_type:complete
MEIDFGVIEFIITAVVFSTFGYFITWADSKRLIVAATIESLIDQGFLKTTGTGDNCHLVKFPEEE